MTTVIQEEMPIRRDITKMKRGSDWHWTIKLKENDRVTPKNTTGYTMTMTIRSGANGEVYDTMTIANGKIVHTPASGQFNLNLTYTLIDGYDFVEAEYDIIIVDNAGGRTCPFYGSVRVIQ
jgi:hypothetical protein